MTTPESEPIKKEDVSSIPALKSSPLSSDRIRINTFESKLAQAIGEDPTIDLKALRKKLGDISDTSKKNIIDRVSKEGYTRQAIAAYLLGCSIAQNKLILDSISHADRLTPSTLAWEWIRSQKLSENVEGKAATTTASTNVQETYRVLLSEILNEESKSTIESEPIKKEQAPSIPAAINDETNVTGVKAQEVLGKVIADNVAAAAALAEEKKKLLDISNPAKVAEDVATFLREGKNMQHAESPRLTKMLDYLRNPVDDIDVLASLGRESGHVWIGFKQTEAPLVIQNIHLLFISLEYEHFFSYVREQCAAPSQDMFGVAVSLMRLDGLARQFSRDKDDTLRLRLDRLIQDLAIQDQEPQAVDSQSEEAFVSPMKNILTVKLSYDPAPLQDQFVKEMTRVEQLLLADPQDMATIAKEMSPLWSLAIKAGTTDQLKAFWKRYRISSNPKE